VTVARRVVLITGANRGIGLAVAEAFARTGAHLALVDLEVGTLERRREEWARDGRQALVFQGDVTDGARVAAIVREIDATLGRIDVLVNNAGIVKRTPVLELGEAEWDRDLAVNLKSVFLFSRAVIPIMTRQRHGRIVSMGSLAGKTGGTPGTPANYAAAKAGVLALTRVLAKEVGPLGITVNAVAPGSVDTGLVKRTPEQLAELLKTIPLGRLGRPEDVAHAILFLASDEAGYITGVSLDVNGGMFTY
jgi:NAD(P)-dependent dehydrogenase (short-subunit alcohol dehydrogenase family)